MCFTPGVSLITAIIEFSVATFILIRYKNYLVPVFSAIFIYVLGAYQFTEFMLCTTNNPLLWATLGFAAYTFLPAIGLHMSIRFTKQKFKNWLLYFPPLVFAMFALLKKNFIIEASCEKVFVLVHSIFPSINHLIPTILYSFYYFIFIILTGIILFKHINKNNMRKIYLLWISLGILIIIMPFILILILPSIGWQYPSIYCEFALLFTIAALVSSEIYHRKKRKEHFIK